MNEPGRSPQDEALQRAIRQLEVADGPPAALDQRIRARAHAAVRRRRGLPLWLSAAASVFLVFFAASLWRYQDGEPLLPPVMMQEPPAAVSDRDDEMDIGAEIAETAPTARSEEVARLQQAPSAPAELSSQAPVASRQAPPPAPRAQMEERAPMADRAPMAPAEPPAAPAQLPSRARAVAVPDPAPTPMAPAPRPSAPPTTADRDAARSSAATSTFQSAEPMAGAAASEAFSAGADQESAGRAGPSERKHEAGPAAMQSDDRRELKPDLRADEARITAKGVAPASLGESFPAACLDDTAERCFERVRRLLGEDRREEALLLLRDTLERHEMPAPDDLQALLE
jgi:hypothetical protein